MDKVDMFVAWISEDGDGMHVHVFLQIGGYGTETGCVEINIIGGVVEINAC